MDPYELESIPLRRRIAFIAIAIAIGVLVLLAIAETAARSMVPRSDPVKIGVRLPGSARLFGLAPNHRSTQLGVLVQTNSLGFREREYRLERERGVTRIVVLGDSYTFGSGVPFEQTYAKRLEKRLNATGSRFEVITFGVPAYNTTAELATWREVAAKFRPDLVIVGYVLNDAEGYGAESAVAGARSGRSLVNAAHVALKDTSMFYRYVAPKLGEAVAMLSGSARYAVGGTNQIMRSFEDGAPGWIESRRALAALAREVRDEGGSLLVAIFPMMIDFATYPLRDAHSRIAAYCREQGIDVIDLLPSFANQDAAQLSVVMDGHPNGAAHRIFADRLFEHLADHYAVGKDGAAQMRYLP